MSERIAAALALLPDYLGNHVLLSAVALALGVLVSVPLILIARTHPRVRWLLLAVAGLIQTIPSIALLALFFPLLLALAAVSARVGGPHISALGFLPSLLALTLYSILPIVRNGVAALTTIDPAIIEAARGVGMTERQMLRKVELPLAAPVLMAGLRTSAVWVIGTATLATPVGQTSLGNYIFSGLQIQDWVSVVFGCVAAALLALVTDALLGLIESGLARRQPRRIALGSIGLLAGISLAVVPLVRGSAHDYTIGAKNFTEQYILASLMQRQLSRAHASAVQRADLGSVFAFQALASSEIDVYAEYSGTLWANVMHRTDNLPRAQMLQEMRRWLRETRGVELLGSLGFENAYALAMRRDQAEALGIRTLEDLARHAPQLRIGADLEFLSRPEWRSLRSAYSLEFGQQRQYQPTFMYRAIASGDVDVISAFSSDGRIAAQDLVVLEDPRGAILPYDAILLIAPARTSDARLHRALAPLLGAIPIRLMQEANQMVDRPAAPQTPAQAAQWLEAAALHGNANPQSAQ